MEMMESDFMILFARIVHDFGKLLALCYSVAGPTSQCYLLILCWVQALDTEFLWCMAFQWFCQTLNLMLLQARFAITSALLKLFYGLIGITQALEVQWYPEVTAFLDDFAAL